MELSSKSAISDLEKYVHSKGGRLSASARLVFERAEELAENDSSLLQYWHVFVSLLQNVPQFREAVSRLGGNIDKAIRVSIESAKDNRMDPNEWTYPDDDSSYSSNQRGDDHHFRAMFIDLCLAQAYKNPRREIVDVDVLTALFEFHDQIFPVLENPDWHDERLHTPYNTLAHIVGYYEPYLAIKFSDILDELNISYRFKSPAGCAPARVRASVLQLLQDYPDYKTNCFIIMSFADTRSHKQIFETIKITLAKFGINALRADDRPYSDDMPNNVLTYIYGCSLAVAVFERIEKEIFNANVSFEVGYIYGLDKPVCLLKERTLRQLQTDIIGKHYEEFDIQDIERTIPAKLEKWLSDKKIIISESRGQNKNRARRRENTSRVS